MDRNYLQTEKFSNMKRRYRTELEESFLYQELYDEFLDRSFEEVQKGIDPFSDDNIKHIRSSEVIAKKFGVSEKTVRNRLRYTKLIPELFEAYAGNMVEKLPLIHLSYLKEEEQMLVVKLLNEGYRIRVDKAKDLKKLSINKETLLSKEEIVEVLKDDKPAFDSRTKVPRRYKVSHDITITANLPAELSENEKFEHMIKLLAEFVKDGQSIIESKEKR